ncbi:MAG: copper chaperone PCu(A)C [Caulobacteraceae bacterium]
MRAFFFALLLLNAAACSPGEAPSHNTPIELREARAAPTPSGVEVSAGYLTVDNNTSVDDRLLRVTSPRAQRVEIHEMIMNGAVMRMRPMETLTIPAHERVILAPGGAHLMFYGVTQPFAEGEEIPVQLTFETAGEVNIVLPVRRSAPESQAGH